VSSTRRSARAQRQLRTARCLTLRPEAEAVSVKDGSASAAASRPVSLLARPVSLLARPVSLMARRASAWLLQAWALGSAARLAP